MSDRVFVLHALIRKQTVRDDDLRNSGNFKSDYRVHVLLRLKGERVREVFLDEEQFEEYCDDYDMLVMEGGYRLTMAAFHVWNELPAPSMLILESSGH